MKIQCATVRTAVVTAGILLGALAQGLSQVTFTRIATGSIVTDVVHSIGCAWGDYDNDGYLDLIFANGYGDANALYHNNGDGTFTRITARAVALTIGDTGGVVWPIPVHHLLTKWKEGASWKNGGRAGINAIHGDGHVEFYGGIRYEQGPGKLDENEIPFRAWWQEGIKP